MKNYKSYFTLILAAFTIFFTACNDEYMENMNTDPSKASTIDPNAQLTTAQLQTYGDLGMVEIYKELPVCIQPTTYGMLEYNKLWRQTYCRQ